MMNDMEEEYECICRLKIVQSECSLESLEFNIDLQPLGMIVKATFFMTYLYQAQYRFRTAEIDCKNKLFGEYLQYL